MDPILLIDRLLLEGVTHLYCVEITEAMVIDHAVRDLCTRPYPGHPYGCPCYGKEEECPPRVPVVEDFLDLSKPHYFLVTEFTERCQEGNLDSGEEHLEKEGGEKRRNHLLKELIGRIHHEFPGSIMTLKPSALGIDVARTAENIGISLDPHPTRNQIRIALISYPHM
ncbi:MAG: hypothetical protein HXS53_12285 [Theionarchaea archaeon]|nr:hypothetical protein [Theionarchaea archaeon]